MRESTDREQLAPSWDVVSRCLAELAAGRDHTPEGDEVGEGERALLEELDRIEGRLGERQRGTL